MQLEIWDKQAWQEGEEKSVEAKVKRMRINEGKRKNNELIVLVNASKNKQLTCNKTLELDLQEQI